MIASGGAGKPQDFLEVLAGESGADAALAASIFHYGTYTVGDLKQKKLSRAFWTMPPSPTSGNFPA